ncbi:MAG: hypothetical protein HAW59_01650 [Betaproteobacteria bacterium]|nr:hypothetical protein [Betaproteobacteria bacterium]
MKKKINAVLFALFVAVMVAGCSGPNINTAVSPAVSVYQSYGDKIPGRFALYVNADKMQDTIKPGYFLSYPVDARAQFVASAQQTLEDIFESVEFVNAPLDRTVLDSGNYDGMVVVEVDSFEVDMRAVHGGLWTAVMEAEAEIIIKVFIDDSSGRLFGATVEGDADDTGYGAVGQSVNSAMKESLRNLAERLANSARLRK